MSCRHCFGWGGGEINVFVCLLVCFSERYVMYMIGADRSPPSGSGSSCGFGNEGDPHHLEGYITMAWSDTLTGPWNKSQHTILTSGVPGRWDAMVRTHYHPTVSWLTRGRDLTEVPLHCPSCNGARVTATSASSLRGRLQG